MSKANELKGSGPSKSNKGSWLGFVFGLIATMAVRGQALGALVAGLIVAFSFIAGWLLGRRWFGNEALTNTDSNDNADTELRMLIEKKGKTGIIVSTVDGCSIVGITERSPAQLNGIQVGDLILMIDGDPCPLNYPSTVMRLVGEPGTNVRIAIRRSETTLEFSLTRAGSTQAQSSNLKDQKGLLVKAGGVVFLLLALVVGKEVGRAASDAILGKRHNSDDKAAALVQASQELNKQLPMMIDKYTRLDSTIAGPGNRLASYYTLVERASYEIDASEVGQKTKEVIAGVCGSNASSGSRKMLDDGITLEYIYRGNDGKEFTRFDVNQQQCVVP